MYKFWRILTFNLWQELNLFSFSSMIIYQLSYWSICKEIQPVHPKGGQSWVFIGRSDVEAETPVFWPPDAKTTHLKRPWCWERLRAGEEGDDRWWDGWMALPTQWTWVWVNFGSWWWTGRPGMLWLMGSQRVGHNWATELIVLSMKLSRWCL